MRKFILFVIVFLVHSSALEAQVAKERSVAWLLQPGGRLLLLYEDGAEVDRRWEPQAGSESFFDAMAVTEAWMVYPDFKVRAFVVGGEVTTVTGWSTASGEEVDSALLPAPQKSLAALLIFPADFRGDVTSPQTTDATVEAIIAEEMKALGLDDDVLSEVPTEEQPTGQPFERLSRYFKGGYSLDSSKQTNSIPPLVSTTRNLYIEYSHDYSFASDDVERTFNGRTSLGTTFNEMSVDYNVGRPAAALDQLSGGINANFEGEKTDDPLASDTLNWGLNGKMTKGVGKDNEFSADMSLDSIDYLASTTTSFDSTEWSLSMGITHFGQEVEASGTIFFDKMTYPEDPAGEYLDFGYTLSANGQRGKIDWDVAYTGTSRGYDDVLSESAQTGTTNDDYRTDELAITSEWNFNNRLSADLSATWTGQDYDNPNETNYDFNTFTFGPDLDWDMGEGWSSTLSFHWTRERYTDRDGDDSDTEPAIQENIDDLDNRELELSLMYSREDMDLSFGSTWSRDHFPTSNQTINDENVDSNSRSLFFTLLWRFAADWSFDFSASRSDEVYSARTEDNTRADALSASLKRAF